MESRRNQRNGDLKSRERFVRRDFLRVKRSTRFVSRHGEKKTKRKETTILSRWLYLLQRVNCFPRGKLDRFRRIFLSGMKFLFFFFFFFSQISRLPSIINNPCLFVYRVKWIPSYFFAFSLRLKFFFSSFFDDKSMESSRLFLYK